jgi:hypothetical protein
MTGRDVLQRGLDAAGNVVEHLGSPAKAGDATFTDNATKPRPVGAVASPGTSLLASPADHQHAQAAPTRIAAAGTTTIAAGARVTLATFKRAPTEMFPPGGFVFIKDDVDGVTWENEVDGGTVIATYHERTANAGELRFRVQNASGTARTIDWATVALALPS